MIINVYFDECHSKQGRQKWKNIFTEQRKTNFFYRKFTVQLPPTHDASAVSEICTQCIKVFKLARTINFRFYDCH